MLERHQNLFEQKQPELNTRRLVLRPLNQDDAITVQCLAGDKKIASVTENIPHPYEDGLAEAWIDAQQVAWRAEEAATFGIVNRRSGQLIGCIGLILTLKHSRASLGYWIGVDFWNLGFATEAGQAVVRFGFDELGLRRLEATHLTRNPASGRVMQKIGMHHEGTLTDYIKNEQRFEDVELYSLINGAGAG